MNQQALKTRNSGNGTWLLLVALLVAGSALIVGRGAMRALDSSGDLRMVYAAGAVWLDGGNPYAFDEVIDVFRSDGGDPGHELTDQQFVTLYPPSSLPLFAPLGLLGFEMAKLALVAFNLLGLVALIGLSARLCGVGDDTRAWLWITALAMLLTPISSTIALGQITIPIVALLMLGLLWHREGRAVPAGIALGIATATKPQLVGLLVLWLAWRGQWRSFTVACVTGIAMIAVAVLRMELGGADWWPGLIDNLQALKDGGMGDPRQSNPAGWWQLMNLPVLLHVFTESRGVVAFINWSVFGLLMLGAVVSGRQYRSACEEPSESASSPSDFLLVPSLLLIACLLPVYHRQYDAVTLLVPLCWLVMRYRERRINGPCMLVAVALLAFYVPNVAVLIKVLVNPRLPSSIAESVWWRGSAMNLLVWSMLAMATGLLWEMARGRRRCPAQAPPDTGGEGRR
ncbi:MAG: glycosyltransferase family 87 protein [Planctomycetota bacterium]|nr:glycosyltransferase family 87 protein [Planctomycetota bacterium]